MRLLPSKQVKEAKDKSRFAEQAAKATLDKIINQEQRQLNVLKANRDPEKEKLEKDFQAFLVSIRDRKAVLLSEVMELESRRNAALKPIDAVVDSIRLELEEKAVTLAEKETSLITKENELNKQEANSSKHLELVKQRRDELGELDTEISARNQESIRLAKDTQKSLQELDKREEEFKSRVTEAESQLIEKEQALLIREKVVEVEKGALEQGRKIADQLKRQLQDQRETLERGFQELRAKQNGPSS